MKNFEKKKKVKTKARYKEEGALWWKRKLVQERWDAKELNKCKNICL